MFPCVAVADICLFDLKNDRSVRTALFFRCAADEDQVGATYYADLLAMLAVCDFVVLACTMNESTARIMGKQQFAAMKNTATIINIGRGEDSIRLSRKKIFGPWNGPKCLLSKFAL